MSVIPVNALTIKSIQNSLNSKEKEIRNKYALQNERNFNKENKNLNLVIQCNISGNLFFD